jgi:hypothetical protein
VGASQPWLQPGDVIRIEEPDYMYGEGRLILRVTLVGRVEGAWVNLMGISLRVDGTPIRDEPRYAMVRVAAIRRYGVPGAAP